MNTVVPLIPDTAPFSPEQRAWLNGFLAGLFSRGPAATGATAPGTPSAAPLIPLTILYGSQTGTAEGLAKRAAREAGKRSFAASVVDMAQMDLGQLAGMKHLLVITSTYGDGEPPDNAKTLHAALEAAGRSSAAPTLSGLRFSVCALGDTNYTQFCRCGADFDAWLEKLGAVRVEPRVDCDLDYEERFAAWLGKALGALSSGPAAAAPVPTAPESHSGTAPPAEESTYSRSRPFPAPVRTVRLLNAEGSAKAVNHVEFDLAGSGLSYEAGDALGVVPQNCPDLVAEILGLLGCDGEEEVPAPDGSTATLRRALTACYDLGKPSADLVSLFAPGGGGGVAVATHHVIDLLLARTDLKPSAADFVRALRRIQPRLYSISSSPRAFPGQVHLTVGAVRYEHAGRMRKGLCSSFLAERAVAAGTVGVFVHANRAFRVPSAGDTPVIMVGPGTGIAPFRAFLQERQATGAKGRNWLFFGDQRAATDFLYREELEGLGRAGVLTRLDTAFSRDQAQKIYVQHRMLEHAAELYAWLEAGAHFYVCGDASRMAKDVDAALHTVIEQAGGKSAEAAVTYVQALKAAKRYARDVY